MNVTDSGEYGDIFEKRGYLYHRAMSKFPHARKLEFDNIFDGCELRSSEDILDVPSLGGYLDSYKTKDINITYADFAPTDGVINLESPYSDWSVGTFDRIISLAATHHITDIEKFIFNIDKHLRPGGIVTIADVEPNSGVSKFLDGYVDKHTITGSHKGFYRDFSKVETPWKIISHSKKQCDWKFYGELTDIAEFCYDLFGLMDCQFSSLIDALDEHIGIESINDIHILKWNLIYTHYVKIDKN